MKNIKINYKILTLFIELPFNNYCILFIFYCCTEQVYRVYCHGDKFVEYFPDCCTTVSSLIKLVNDNYKN